MLDELYIENIAVIEKACISFNNGFNVLTGETGAGKSIIIGAVNAILGGKISKECIRAGKEKAFISASFSNVPNCVYKELNDYGCESDDKTLIIQRKININGKNSCYINSKPVPLFVLKNIGKNLVNIHGQHESYGLLSEETHIHYIDKLGNITDDVNDYKKLFLNIKNIEEQIEKLKNDNEDKERKTDLLTYQINEIENACLVVGEFEKLNKLKNKCSNGEKIKTELINAKDAIFGKDEFYGALNLIQNSCKSLQNACQYDDSLNKIYQRINDTFFELEDISHDLNQVINNVDFDPFELQEIEQRLDVIYKIIKKYGGTEEKAFEYLKKCKQELNEMINCDEEIEKLNKKLYQSKEKMKIIADKITNERNKTAKQFSKMVKKELEFLDMPNVNFVVFQSKCDFNILGQDKIEFLISTNKGQPPKSISKIASGGELSRIMLAIKNVLAEKDDIDTLIFDEVDTGIGGSAAYKVGLKLYSVSKNRQVICITHKAQIAAIANNHFFVEKSVKSNETYTNIKKLDTNQKEMEIARMLGGIKITTATLNNAKEMIKISKNYNTVQT